MALRAMTAAAHLKGKPALSSSAMAKPKTPK